MKPLSELLTRSDISSCTAFYLSDTQANKMSASLDSLADRSYYMNKFVEDLMSLFVWEGLPDNIPSYIIEYLLMSVGRVCMYYDEEKKEFAISRYAMVAFNDYYEPVTINTISIATKPRPQLTLNYWEFEYCWCNNTGYPPFDTAWSLCDRIWHIEKTITYLQKQMRRPTIFYGSKSMKQTVDRLMNEDDPQTWYVISSDASKLEGVPLTSVDIGKGLEILIKLRDVYLQEWNSRVALHAYQNDKKERNTQFEAEGYAELGNINIAGFYKQRQFFSEKMNKHWGLNTSVRYNDIISTRGEPIRQETNEEGEVNAKTIDN